MTRKTKIVAASDHAGYSLKQSLLKSFMQHDIAIYDKGCNDGTSVDYPDYAFSVVDAIINNEANMGILICYTGIGMSMAANRSKKIRAALCHNKKTAELSRKHNNANIICLGSLTVNHDEAFDIIKTFITTDFEGGRHINRINKIDSRD